MIPLPDKDPAEVIVVAFDFAPELDPGESISAAQVTAAVRGGADASPSNILSGALSIVSPQVLQKVAASVDAVVYLLRCAGTTSAGRVLVITASLASRQER